MTCVRGNLHRAGSTDAPSRARCLTCCVLESGSPIGTVELRRSRSAVEAELPPVARALDPAGIREADPAVAKPHASVMSRRDPPTEPTSQMRRWARHRIAFTVQAVICTVAVISLAVYQVTTQGPRSRCEDGVRWSHI
jgi:hypothetical protein